VYLGRDPVTGKERVATKTVRSVGKREAQRLLNEFVVNAERGLEAKTTTTVGDLLDRWFELAQNDFSPKTNREVAGFIERNLRPALGDVRLTKLTAASLDRFYQRLLKDGGKGGRPLAPSTIRRIHGILRRALAQGVRWGWLGQNPAASATPPRVQAPDIKPPTPDEVRRLLAEIADRDPELLMFVRLSAMTGARRSEVIAIRWSDLDLEEGVVTISRGVVMGPHGLVEKDTKTHQARRVALDPETVRMLVAHQTAVEERANTCGTKLVDNGFVFSADVEARTPWYPDSVSRRFRQACRRIGLDGVRLHDLRHYVATRLLSAGVDVRTVAGRLGHRNAATTLNVYSHFVPEADRHAAELIAGLGMDLESGGT
jgi:integrase